MIARGALKWLVFSLGIAIAAACSQTTTQKPATLCTPSMDVYCRCQNFDEGTKTCADDGQSFGPCLPCEGDMPFMEDAGPPIDDAGDLDATKKEAGESGADASTCGDKKVEPGEACDDGNAIDDDGCNGKCEPQGGYPATAGICPGMSIDVWSVPVAFDTTTVGFPISYRANAACGMDAGIASTGSTGSDRVFAVTPHATGKLAAAATSPTFDVMLYARSDCATQSSELGCANAGTSGSNETLTFAVTSGTTYYVFVDATNNTSGTLTLTFSVK